jgi:hypothetical protein
MDNEEEVQDDDLKLDDEIPEEMTDFSFDDDDEMDPDKDH